VKLLNAMIDEFDNDDVISTHTDSILTHLPESESSSKISSLEQNYSEPSSSKVVSECKSVTFAEYPKIILT